MKILLAMFSLIMGASASAASLTCTAKIEVENENYEKVVVKEDTRTMTLNKDGDAELVGIIVDSNIYDRVTVNAEIAPSYNYGVWVSNGKIISASIENEVIRGAVGVDNLKDQTTLELGSISNNGRLNLNCSVK
ncbi:hypothetical protein [Bdellovibrio sp. HCB-110]|uniref:hypothetical protein n=1 Tax=Bdellovibrio sp. HCB-110 TaxID=3391182 RepID=UPI0039B53C11